MLLHDQHEDLAYLPLIEFAQGWDNTLFRLGDDLRTTSRCAPSAGRRSMRP